MNYSNSLKKQMCIDVCVNGKSTIRTAEANAVPLKTFEKWITAFRKNPNCFNSKSTCNNFQIINRSSRW